jgi:hypothetical protein
MRLAHPSHAVARDKAGPHRGSPQPHSRTHARLHLPTARTAPAREAAGHRSASRMQDDERRLQPQGTGAYAVLFVVPYQLPSAGRHARRRMIRSTPAAHDAGGRVPERRGTPARASSPTLDWVVSPLRNASTLSGSNRQTPPKLVPTDLPGFLERVDGVRVADVQPLHYLAGCHCRTAHQARFCQPFRAANTGGGTPSCPLRHRLPA